MTFSVYNHLTEQQIKKDPWHVKIIYLYKAHLLNIVLKIIFVYQKYESTQCRSFENSTLSEDCCENCLFSTNVWYILKKMKK